MPGAPKGNNNAGNGTVFRDMIRTALANYEDKTVQRGQALRAIADKIVSECLAGNMVAVKELGDRLDGKAAQAVTVSNPDGTSLFKAIERVIIDGNEGKPKPDADHVTH